MPHVDKSSRACPVSFEHMAHDTCDGSPANEAALLADEIESVGKGLGILGRSIEGGRTLLPEEDALVLAALRAFATPSAEPSTKAKRWQEIADQRAIEVADLRLALRWCMEHPGECLGDHPAKLKLAKEALK
jgi:hypothetical protein